MAAVGGVANTGTGLSINDLPIELVDAILDQVTAVDRIVCAHVSSRWRAILGARPRMSSPHVARLPNFISGAVCAGLWHLVEWAREHGCPWDDTAATIALAIGRGDLFQRLVALGCPVSPITCARTATIQGDTENLGRIIAMGRLNRCDGEDVFYAAAGAGQINALNLLCAYDYGCGDPSCWARPLVVFPRVDKPLTNMCICDEHVGCEAARGGHMEMLQWLQDKGCHLNAYTLASAAEGGQIEAVAWLHNNGAPFKSMACSSAAAKGRLEALQWLRANGCPWDKMTCFHAAYEGHLATLQWAMANGCPWDRLATTFAVIGGHLDVAEWTLSQGCALITECDDQAIYHQSVGAFIYEDTALDVVARTDRLDVLEWLRAHGCLATSWTFLQAARHGKLAVLDWLHQHCRPWDQEVCAVLAYWGMLDALQYVRARGCPWDENVCARAAAGGRLQVLQWAVANGCPWDRHSICYVAAPYCGLQVLQWLVAQGCAWDDHIPLAVAKAVHEPDLLAWIVQSGRPWDLAACLNGARQFGQRRVVAWIQEYRANASVLRPPEPVY